MSMFSSRPDICHGEPCFYGTRVPVAAVWKLKAQGYSPSDIQRRYPDVSVDALILALSIVDWPEDRR